MSGTVNISRCIWEDTAFKAQPFTEREAFMWLVMEASWKAREKRVGTVAVKLERGQLATSIRFMAAAWSWQKSTVDRFLKRLENRDMIGTASGTGVTVITICKYNEYQGGDRQSGTPPAVKSGQQRDTSGTNEKKGLIPEVSLEEKKVVEPVGSKPTATAQVHEFPKQMDLIPPEPPDKQKRRKPLVALPQGWVPSDRNVEYAREKTLSDQEINHEADKFRHYYTSTGKNFRDWDSVWSGWVLRYLEKRPARPMAGPAVASRGGQGSSLASIAARRRASGEV